MPVIAWVQNGKHQSLSLWKNNERGLKVWRRDLIKLVEDVLLILFVHLDIYMSAILLEVVSLKYTSFFKINYYFSYFLHEFKVCYFFVIIDWYMKLCKFTWGSSFCDNVHITLEPTLYCCTHSVNTLRNHLKLKSLMDLPVTNGN